MKRAQVTFEVFNVCSVTAIVLYFFLDVSDFCRAMKWCSNLTFQLPNGLIHWKLYTYWNQSYLKNNLNIYSDLFIVECFHENQIGTSINSVVFFWFFHFFVYDIKIRIYVIKTGCCRIRRSLLSFSQSSDYVASV